MAQPEEAPANSPITGLSASTTRTQERKTPNDAMSDAGISPEETQSSPPRQERQKLVFTDPVAFRYLEEDPLTTVLTRRRILTGYEIYIVEQWACSRIHPTFIITTYTGDPSHSVVAGVLSVPTDESTWSPRLKVYFSAVSQFHARKRETPFGNLMVTNLSGFPSALTVIAVPDGDVKKHREDFLVNENLKRLGCSGRAGLNLQPPTAVTRAKFHQLYRTSERVPFYNAVVELVRQCQMALTIFDKLAPEYVDGLLCDVTERAITYWWNDIGTDFFNVEPSDGILGPTTVSALLGMLMGARNRLSAYGAPVGKDVFDIDGFKRGIGSFQKSQKMDKTRRLDPQTCEKLHQATAKAASGEGWAVPRAVKSTVAELSGKGGEMVMGMVGGRDKAGIAEVETLDMDRFVQLVSGERPKWLWLGKPRKTSHSNVFGNGSGDDEMVFTQDEQGRYAWAGRKRESGTDISSARPEHTGRTTEPSTPFDERDPQSKKTVLRSVTGKVSDARTGFGRFKDAVGIPGLRSHHHKHSKEGVDLESDLAYKPVVESDIDPSTTDLPFENEPGGCTEARNDTAPEQFEETNKPKHVDSLSPKVSPEQRASHPSLTGSDLQLGGQDTGNAASDTENRDLDVIETRSDVPVSKPDLLEGTMIKSLRRPQSFSYPSGRVPSDARWPRHLSFSVVEETVNPWDDIQSKKLGPDGPGSSLVDIIRRENIMASDARIFSGRILDLSQNTASWAEDQVGAVENLQHKTQSRHEELHNIYMGRLQEYQSLRTTSSDLISKEGASLQDDIKHVEMLGAKLDYELNVLQSRVEEVESGAEEFERHVVQIETRVKDLVDEEKTSNSSSWFQWGANFFSGSGQRS
ncbi:hypothetical protein FQN54_005564 [Arachnomyces sp. PD_36]|nr:hypothetical protein FQN54_005564 [Arachnomyces sp. PD_36]